MLFGISVTGIVLVGLTASTPAAGLAAMASGLGNIGFNLWSNRIQKWTDDYADEDLGDINHDLEYAFVYAWSKLFAERNLQYNLQMPRIAGWMQALVRKREYGQFSIFPTSYVSNSDPLVQMGAGNPKQVDLFADTWPQLIRLAQQAMLPGNDLSHEHKEQIRAAMEPNFAASIRKHFRQTLKLKEFARAQIAFENLLLSSTYLAVLEGNEYQKQLMDLFALQKDDLAGIRDLLAVMVKVQSEQIGIVGQAEFANAVAKAVVAYQGESMNVSRGLHAEYQSSQRVKELQQFYCGDEEPFTEFTKLVTSNQRISIFAEWGMGKSAFLANWLMRADHPLLADGNDLIVASHFFSTLYVNSGDTAEPTTDPAMGLAAMIRQLIPYTGRTFRSDSVPLDTEGAAEALRIVAVEAAKQSKRRVVLVFDALDESTALVPFVFQPMPPNVSIVSTVRRTDTGENSNNARQFGNWIQGATPYHLPQVTPDICVRWLAHVGNGELAPVAEQASKIILQAAGRIPILLRFLIEDALVMHKESSKDFISRLHEAAEKVDGMMEAYCAGQVKLMVPFLDENSKNLYRALCYSPQPIPSRVLRELFHLDRIAIGQANNLVQRWWSRIMINDGRDYSVTFPHPRVQAGFRSAIDLEAHAILPTLLNHAVDGNRLYTDSYFRNTVVQFLAYGRNTCTSCDNTLLQKVNDEATSYVWMKRRLEEGEWSAYGRDIKLLLGTK